MKLLSLFAKAPPPRRYACEIHSETSTILRLDGTGGPVRFCLTCVKELLARETARVVDVTDLPRPIRTKEPFP